MHACDRQTDRRTDRITTPKTALAYARAVKLNSLMYYIRELQTVKKSPVFWPTLYLDYYYYNYDILAALSNRTIIEDLNDF